MYCHWLLGWFHHWSDNKTVYFLKESNCPSKGEFTTDEELTLTLPPIQVNTGVFLPPLVTIETRWECRSLLVTDASSAFGARPLHEALWQRKVCDVICRATNADWHWKVNCNWNMSYLGIFKGHWWGIELIAESTDDLPCTHHCLCFKPRGGGFCSLFKAYWKIKIGFSALSETIC